MKRAIRIGITLMGAAIFSTATVHAQSAERARFINAKVETRSAAGGLDATVKSIVAAQTEGAWIGYSVPITKGSGQSCCGDSRYGWGCCRLEGSNGNTFINSGNDAGPNGVKLEGPAALWVLLRVENHAVGKVVSYSEDCQLDAGGLKVVWLTDAKAAESVTLLSNYAVIPAADKGDEDRPSRKLRDGAVTAIALHADPAADKALDSFVAPSQPESLRKQATFWLGNARGHHGYETLRRIVREDPSDKIREHAIFSLSQSKDPEAVSAMIDAAKNDKSIHVRGQGLFWLAQKAGVKAAGAINDAIETDPDTEVKKKAVFALSQLPKDEGVPRLIQVARNNRNSEVRKQAVFWLGQSNDPRALAFFEEVLVKR
ncbi:MAG: HEAT repeat domain-containing protein [Acidobacteria bacterium]|nr:HEAT repeat domain-containing protein [Acidobacteriota bacterium]